MPLPSWPARRAIPTRVGKTKDADFFGGFFPGHPHACGENQCDRWKRSRGDGPSPRVWGKPFDRATRAAIDRAIPTRVGKTTAGASCGMAKTGHPHACGENPTITLSDDSRPGPSPRVWGKLEGYHLPGSCRRAIPTRVGKTMHTHTQADLGTGHPHACGENQSAHVRKTNHRGPSPRVWGKPENGQADLRQQRAIPTRVGKTWIWIMSATPAAGHPHACGENS